MAKLRRAVERRLAYAPRFLRHYRNRRQLGCTPAVAFRSARERMRQPPPMIVSPSCANRFAKSVSIRRSPRPCQSCASARWAWRGSLRTCGCCLGEGAIGSPGCSGVVGHRFPAKSRRDPRSQVNSPCLPAARLRHGHPAVWVAPKEEGVDPRALIRRVKPPGRWGNARRADATRPAFKTSNARLSPRGAG